ncbi:thermonuclease family protein [Thiorhodococcus fuscus]|uniref:Thermonuclease family protein n=1 Tax=Thiorhodococcus fuscus TaxID=527200 RepID=A0ABW4Y5D9_9GAMM
MDGDSVVLSCSRKRIEVRLHCIDAPEKDQRPWADRSRNHLRRILPDRVEMIPIERDRFGRLVADLYSDTPKPQFINLEQVVSGNAAVYRRYCSNPKFQQAERKAREAERGIWSTPGLHQTPWRFRHDRHRARSNPQ